MGRVWLRGRPARPPPFLVLACGVGVCAGPGSRLCPALLAWVVGVCFLRFFAGCPCPGPCDPCPPIPFLSGWAAGSFFSFFRAVCLLVSVSLIPVGRCSWLRVAGFGWVVPLCLFGGPVFGAFWGGFGRLWWCMRAVWWLWAVFAPPPPSPLCFFFFGRGGPACSSLCLPSAGARTGPHSVRSSGLLLSVAFCLAVFRPHGSGQHGGRKQGSISNDQLLMSLAGRDNS